jgi:isoquinoline 1-oxidoreductase beta subunit
LDIPDKVQGAAVFGIDVREPDALQGAVARPPAYGAKLAGYDRAAAEAVADVRAVVELATGVAVVAGSREAALRGRDALKVRWDRTGASTLDTATLETTFLEKLDDVGLVAKDEGDAAKALREAIRKVEARYTLPYLAHTTMEPMNCTARVSADGCDVWVPTQNQTGVQQLAAQISGLPPEQVRVHTTYLGCGLGRRFEVDVVRETLALAKATKATVQVIWSREEDVQNDFYRPGNACIIRGGLDASGKIVAWQHRVAAPSIFARAMPGMVKDGVDPAAVEGIEDTVYRIPNLRVEYVRVDLPVPVGFWRSVGNSHNAFTVESFIDELAHAAGQDPLAFRLAHLPEDSPARALLQWVAEKAGWGRPPGDGRALGIAQHHSFGSYVAQVAEVSVDRKDGRVRVHRIVAAVDCGQVVNPDTVTAQIEGAVVMGLSAALKERVTFRNGGVSSENFQDYDLLRMDEVPEIQVHVRPSGGFLGGVGEPGLPPTAPAVANAVFAATGVRVRTLPMTPSLILETLKKG